MRKSLIVLPLFAVSLFAGVQTWKDAPLVDAMCATQAKANPDKHTRECSIGCSKSGLGILTADGTFLRFDKTGAERAVAALKAAQKPDHIRATVTGERQGDTIKVSSLTLN
jgi:hypothetical protein